MTHTTLCVTLDRQPNLAGFSFFIYHVGLRVPASSQNCSEDVGAPQLVTVGVLISPAKVEQVKFDALSMHVQPQVAAQQKMVDDGSGEVQVSEGWGRTGW